MDRRPAGIPKEGSVILRLTIAGMIPYPKTLYMFPPTSRVCLGIL
jgi:hypothetical protein